MNKHYATKDTLVEVLRIHGRSGVSGWSRTRLVKEALCIGAITELAASELRFKRQVDAADRAFLDSNTTFNKILGDIEENLFDYYTSDDYCYNKGFRNYNACNLTNEDHASARHSAVLQWMKAKGGVHAAMTAVEAPASIRRAVWSHHVEKAAEAWAVERVGVHSPDVCKRLAREDSTKASQCLEWTPLLSTSPEALKTELAVHLEAAVGPGIDMKLRRERMETLVTRRLKGNLCAKAIRKLLDEGDEQEVVDRAIAEVLQEDKQVEADSDFLKKVCWYFDVPSDQVTHQLLANHSRKGVKDWECRHPGCTYVGSASGVHDHNVNSHGTTSLSEVRAKMRPQ